MFELFDPKGELRITAGNLPHWFQPGATYFVTFRTADSIPKAVSDLWHRRRRDWLQRHGIPPANPAWRSELDRLPLHLVREFHDTFSTEFLTSLDAGHGECVLRNVVCREIVAKALRHFDGTRYHLGDFVIMPNHVHLLVGLIGDSDIEKVCYSWKKFTAIEINRLLRLGGEFWQSESFDHLVRSSDQFEAIQRYIEANPSKARLHQSNFLYERCVIPYLAVAGSLRDPKPNG
jgi:REP element-mobilizing transposase RayT